VLLNGFATYACESCLGELEAEVEAAQRAAEEWELDWRGAFKSGAIACALCALTWFLTLSLTGYMNGILAAGFGVVIGIASRKGAGTGNFGVSLLSAAYTLFAIVLGQLAFIAQELSIAGEYSTIFAVLPDLPGATLATINDWSFALGAGLVGAWISAALGQQREFVEVPTLSVERPEPAAAPAQDPEVEGAG